MRGEMVERLVRDGIEGGTLALWEGGNAAIEATEATAKPTIATLGARRAILADDGGAMRPTLNREGGAATAGCCCARPTATRPPLGGASRTARSKVYNPPI
jgi:hypothetical protein